MTVVTACVVVLIYPSAGQKPQKTLREKGTVRYPVPMVPLAVALELEALV
jgi:hypothetical protein